MIVIKHKGGWSCSNSAEIHIRKLPIITNGKTTGFKSNEYCSVYKPFTVSGDINGDVKAVIKDDTTGELHGFSGVYNNGRINITQRDTCIKWLEKI